MAPCFVSSVPLVARSSLTGSSVCKTSIRSSVSAQPQSRNMVTMAAANKNEKKSLGDWLYGKFMHNALWDGDEEAGYELYFKDAMDAREEETKKAYEDMDKNKKSS